MPTAGGLLDDTTAFDENTACAEIDRALQSVVTHRGDE
jgi:hypothetical protein